MNYTTSISNHFKNIPGWRTKRKYIAFAVDDYGNIRLHSERARAKLTESGVPLVSRFDLFDSLDTKGDFEELFNVLGSVKDSNNNHAIFTTYALPCNVNFEETIEKGEYVPEKLNVTYEKLSSQMTEYYGAFDLLRHGINMNFLRPQFHGREHLNVNLFNKLLLEANPQLLTNIKNLSLAKLPTHDDLPNLNFNQAFAFWREKDIDLHKVIIKDGLQLFEEVYGYRSMTFTPPAQKLHHDLFEYVYDLGLEGVDKERTTKRHLGEGKFKREWNHLGQQKRDQPITIVRNCVFEPTLPGLNWVEYTLKQIEAAFFWKKPAIISSHRVNFCGNIDVENREMGLKALKQLLQKIEKKWPEVEFISIDNLIKKMQKC